MAEPKKEIRLNESENWYEVLLDGNRVALAHFVPNGEVRIFDHTETDEDHEGQGLAGQVVQFALDDVRAKGLKICPTCPYVIHWLKQHPDYIDLVA
ncbi:MAG: N-acetyltransferase [Propionibacteriaceae bacterium]|jgi:predicted GNAT family acetyltransferase|nr:N-acetyltransferase [Propionibacteriaceae bacterium]